jgi:two-component system OmpR family response regulator
MQYKILLIDDSVEIAALVVGFLKSAGYAVKHVVRAEEGLDWLKKEQVDLLLLDVELPGISGFKVLELLKKDSKTASIPVIMITVRNEEASKVGGLRGGADDYLVKPFSRPELLARVEALLRRVHNAGHLGSVVVGGDISLDMKSKTASSEGKRVNLTSVEFDLLALLISGKGQVFTFQAIAEKLGNPSWTSNNLSVHVKNIRAKLGAPGKKIESVHATGYRFFDK